MTKMTNDRSDTAPSAAGSPREAAELVLRLCVTATGPEQLRAQLEPILAGGIDEAYLIDLAGATGVMPLVAGRMVSCGCDALLSAESGKEIRRRYRQNLYYNMLVSDEYAMVLQALDKSRLPYIYLKGAVLAEQLYDDPALRSSVDLDILVRADDLTRARDIIEEAGYRRTEKHTVHSHPFHDEYRKTASFNSFIELHWNLSDEASLNIPLPVLWKRKQHFRTGNRKVNVLSHEDCLLHLCLQQINQTGHFLRYLSDIDRLLRRYGASLDWDYLMESGRTWGFTTGFLYTLNKARAYFGSPLPATILGAIARKRRKLRVIDFLTRQLSDHAPEAVGKIELEALTFARSLMMDTRRGWFGVLKRYRRSTLRVWLLTAFWLTVVTAGAIRRRAGAIRR